MKRILLYTVTAGLLAAPFLIIAQRYGQLNPYHLPGPHFLVFFISHSLGIHGSLIIRRSLAVRGVYEPTLFPGLVIVFSMIIALARLIQGICNHKPVGYLILLLLLNSIIYTMLWQAKRPISRPG